MYFSIGTVAFVAAALSMCPILAQKDSNKPNVVFILTDDQDARMDSLSHMQQTQKLLMDQGVQFTKHYAHVALCCPSRVTLWTGQHAHNHNVTDVGTPYGGWPKVQDVGLWNRYLPVWLKEKGYNTYYSGKLYNAHSKENYDREGKYAAGWTESVSSC
jgi:N-acetylglucosamine-6-sulfatase